MPDSLKPRRGDRVNEIFPFQDAVVRASETAGNTVADFPEGLRLGLVSIGPSGLPSNSSFLSRIAARFYP